MGFRIIIRFRLSLNYNTGLTKLFSGLVCYKKGKLQFLHQVLFFVAKNNEILSVAREHIIGKMEWPTKLDVAGSVFSLVTIQYTYKIPITDLAKGKLGKRDTKATLTIDDIEDIVHNRMKDHTSLTHLPGKDYAIAIEWLEAAVR